MKLIFFCIVTLFAGISAASAQNEMLADTIIATSRGVVPEKMPLPERKDLPDGVKNYDGFLLEMKMLNMAPPKLPKFALEIPDASKDYSFIFRLNPDVTYSQGLSNLFSLSNSHYFGSNPFGLTSFWNSTDNLQMGSFKLKNGMRINTYGEYDKDGWKVPNPSALPWEKNDFKGAFEIKSPNGSFGIRIEVQQGRTPYRF